MEWRDLEEHVWRVYDRLLNLKDEGVMVAHDVQLRGRDGINHQVDVYYEFMKAGLRHRVAIECKNTGRKIEKKEVLAFKSMLDDVIGVKGVMIATNGYQSGAKQYADHNGILALEFNDLPSLGMLLGARLASVALPDEKEIGEPFWTLYEIHDGSNTGTPFAYQQGDELFGVLFFSKKHATDYLNHLKIDKKYAVFGLPQRCLRSYILIADSMRGRFCLVADTGVEGSRWLHQEIPRSNLIEEYYVASNSIPVDPMVAPSRKK